MVTFLVALVALIAGYLLYGVVVEKVFGIDEKAQTPALTKTDGVDYVPMSPWRIFLVQFLNIAGLGPIFGAIMGIFFGPAAFLWIVFGTIFAGGVHDYLSGMMSIRKGGLSLPDIIGEEVGNGTRMFMRVLSLVLLILLTTTFLSGPATLLQGLCSLPTWQPFADMTIAEEGYQLGTSPRIDLTLPIVWICIIFAYYVFATVLPVDKLIGRFYPIFGGILLFMGIGIMVIMLGWHSSEMPELTDGLYNRNTNGLPLFPMMFVSIACGAISGFHGTQSPIMARCVTNERQGRIIFYGAMVAEGILALIWAAAAGTFFADPEKGLYGIDGLQAFAAEHAGENIAALVVDRISRSWLGLVGGVLAIIGVIAAPITSGDTALRSARLIVADFLKLDQKPIRNRLYIAVPLFVCVFGFLFVDFNVVWRYFAWTNQTLAVFTLWAGTLFLAHQQSTTHPHGYWVALIPAVFMTVVSVSYIMIAPEGLHFPAERRWIAYGIALLLAASGVVEFFYRQRHPQQH
ncbi:MAG: carbon starvation protein A [Paludibacteraceae bacterium]|nr:carbon starvation protein A [Paludibacteraceae bacterium]